MLFRLLYDDMLAQASYLVGCQRTGEALVIDPERDVERYIDSARKEGLKITCVAETHIHADFLSGARELAEKTGARLYLSDEGGPDWSYRWLDKKQGGGSYQYHLLKDGDTFKVGAIEIQAVHTPGHTPEHLSFLVTDRGGGATEPLGIATGDFVFVGDVGRPDLLETAAGQSGAKDASARQLYQSLQQFVDLPDYLQVWPGHGSGSACGKALGAVPQSTVGYEKRFNAAIDAAGKEESYFVHGILNGLVEPPYYFGRMKKENRDGPALLGKMPEPREVEASEIPKLMAAGTAVVDTRSWSHFMHGHLKRSLHAPFNRTFPTVVASYVSPDSAIYLVIDAAKVKDAVTCLVRVGLDNIAGYLTPATLAAFREQGGELASLRELEVTELKRLQQENSVEILDVRNSIEYGAGHIPQSRQATHTRLLEHLDKFPKDRALAVHCQTGSRSRVASAMLAHHGFDVIHLAGGFSAWRRAGGETTRE